MKAGSAGRFITVEGIEGVGKSTHMDFIAEQLRQRGKTVRVTREPGGTRLGEALRTILLDPDQAGIGADAELLLMFAARAQHLDEIVKPALNAGEYVLSDRFTDATYAYQGGGRRIDNARIGVLERLVQDELKPDLVILLDAPVELAMSRAGARSKSDRFELENAAFFKRVRAAYLHRAADPANNYVIIDGSRSIGDVQSQISAQLHQWPI